MKQYIKQHKAISIIISILIIILILFLSIIFRGRIVPLYVNTFYKGSVSTIYHLEFDNINKQFLSLGLNTIEQPATCYNGVSDSGNAWFHYLRETVPCMKQSVTKPLKPNDQFQTSWETNAVNINSNLLSNGWKDTTNKYGLNIKLNELLKNPGDDYTYSKTINKYNCILMFQYYSYSGKTSTKESSSIYVVEMCTRNVSFFGGYID